MNVVELVVAWFENSWIFCLNIFQRSGLVKRKKVRMCTFIYPWRRINFALHCFWGIYIVFWYPLWYNVCANFSATISARVENCDAIMSTPKWRTNDTKIILTFDSNSFKSLWLHSIPIYRIKEPMIKSLIF